MTTFNDIHDELIYIILNLTADYESIVNFLSTCKKYYLMRNKCAIWEWYKEYFLRHSDLSINDVKEQFLFNLLKYSTIIRLPVCLEVDSKQTIIEYNYSIFTPIKKIYQYLLSIGCTNIILAKFHNRALTGGERIDIFISINEPENKYLYKFNFDTYISIYKYMIFASINDYEKIKYKIINSHSYPYKFMIGDHPSVDI